MSAFDRHARRLDAIETRRIGGTVHAVRGLSILVEQFPAPVGTMVELRASASDRRRVLAAGEVVGFEGGRTVVMLFGPASGIAPGAWVEAGQSAQMVAVGASLIGRVIDGLGRPIDGGPPLRDTALFPLESEPTPALRRRRISEPMPTGVRAIDAMATIGKGQRVGIFSGPGVGKSTLLAMIARNTAADINVIGLIGERGREVRDFIDGVLGEEGLARSIVIVSTSDEAPIMRVRAASVACAVAEWFRSQGRDVLLMMDSITRFAQAQRQIGLTVGEQPATKGYTPSVFAMLPRLLERAGTIDGQGSITGLYTVLVEGDDLTEPVSDACRGILDGHVALSRRLAGRGHFPSIDLMESISRVANDVTDQPHQNARRMLLRLIAAHAEAEELISIGAYAVGSNPDCDVAIEMKPALDEYFQQTVEDRTDYPHCCRRLVELGLQAEERLAALRSQRPAMSPGPMQNAAARTATTAGANSG
jgi:flagellum-specific ATP synthase